MKTEIRTEILEATIIQLKKYGNDIWNNYMVNNSKEIYQEMKKNESLIERISRYISVQKNEKHNKS